MLTRSLKLAAVAVLAWGGSNAAAQADVLSARNFNDLLRAVRPSPGEAQWMQIPWENDLNVAAKKAAAQGKPLFIWAMAGEPLGTC
jgi:hypothetical protein